MSHCYFFLTQIADYCQGSDRDPRGESSATSPLSHGRSRVSKPYKLNSAALLVSANKSGITLEQSVYYTDMLVFNMDKGC
jgi:hypothetical protein